MAQSFSNSPYYDIGCYSGNYDYDLTNCLRKIVFIGSINTPYFGVIIDFLTDPKDMILNSLFGNSDLVLTISFHAEDKTILEANQFKLMTLKTEMSVPIPIIKDKKSIVTTTVRTYNVPHVSFSRMNSSVSKVFKDITIPAAMVKSIIDDFTWISKNSTDLSLQKGGNPNFIQQFLIPPMTFINAIKYIHGTDRDIVERYGPGVGLFSGVMFAGCQLIDNTFCLWDLKEKIKDAPEYKLFMLTGGADNDKILENAGKTSFPIRQPVIHMNKTNQNVAIAGTSNIFITKPLDNLEGYSETDIDSLFEKNGLKSGSGKVSYNPALDTRVNYHTYISGSYDLDGEGKVEKGDSTSLHAGISEKIAENSEFIIKLDRNLRLNKLSRIGIPVSFDTQTSELSDFHGNYIVGSVKIVFVGRGGVMGWVNNTTLKIFRGNLYSKEKRK